MKVLAGQRWLHRPSGKELTVLAVVDYRDRVGVDPTERDL